MMHHPHSCHHPKNHIKTVPFSLRVIRDTSFEHFPERYLLDSYEEPLYFETIEEAAKCVSDIVGHPIEPSVEAIDQALEDYLTEHESDDTWYSFHEFIEDRDD